MTISIRKLFLFLFLVASVGALRAADKAECELTSVTITDNVIFIEDNPFAGCSRITSLVVEPGHPIYDSRDNCNGIIRTADNTLIVGCQSTVIPASVTAIEEEAVLDCSTLTAISIPASVTAIGRNAFSGCTALRSLTVAADNPIYDSRDSSNAIIATKSKTLIVGCAATVIPASVTYIDAEAFAGCTTLTAITIPAAVKGISRSAFDGCTGLQSLTILRRTPPTVAVDAFRAVDPSTPVYVPAESLSLYQNSEMWKYFKNIKVIEDKEK